MSRIGNRILTVPEGVTVSANDGVITVNGPKGTLSTKLHDGLKLSVEDGTLSITRDNEGLKAIHGTTNANVKNMIEGVTKGFSKELEIIGVGYRFTLKGNTLVINAGYSNPVEMEIPSDLKVEAASNTEIKVVGISKERVGEFAANIRKVRKPEPYKGKGIRYKDEHVRRKEGKKAA